LSHSIEFGRGRSWCIAAAGRRDGNGWKPSSGVLSLQHLVAFGGALVELPGALVELPLEFRVGALKIGYRIVDDRGTNTTRR
jgi:hypothetical protein